MAQLPIHPKNSNFDAVAQGADVNDDWYQNNGLRKVWFRNDHPTETVQVEVIERSRCSFSHHYPTQGVFRAYTISLGPGGALASHGPFHQRWSIDATRNTTFTYTGSLTFSGNPSLWVAIFEGY